MLQRGQDLTALWQKHSKPKPCKPLTRIGCRPIRAAIGAVLLVSTGLARADLVALVLDGVLLHAGAHAHLEAAEAALVPLVLVHHARPVEPALQQGEATGQHLAP